MTGYEERVKKNLNPNPKTRLTMKICANANIYDVQKSAHGVFIVQSNGKTLFPETRGYQMAVAEFKRIMEDQAYAEREARSRAA